MINAAVVKFDFESQRCSIVTDGSQATGDYLLFSLNFSISSVIHYGGFTIKDFLFSTACRSVLSLTDINE